MWELRQFARGATGLKGLKEIVIYHGAKGDNRKSTTVGLLLGAFGSTSAEGERGRGYVCVQKASYFERKAGGGARDPDEGVAATRGAKYVIADEFSQDAIHFDWKTAREWDTDGQVLPFEQTMRAA